ncbi:MAG TPA: AraC family transcriptional regulator [Thermoanaerobaculia bacterium]|nr:AraC family transcriptional regulator [Thermoanaerobaculia bacterium]
MTEIDAWTTIIERYVTLCCVLETPPRVSELAQLIGVSTVTLGRQARRHYVALAKELKDAQLARAQGMLRITEESMTRIAYACGFGTRRTFFRTFQRAVGMTPAQYRESMRDDDRTQTSQ